MRETVSGIVLGVGSEKGGTSHWDVGHWKGTRVVVFQGWGKRLRTAWVHLDLQSTEAPWWHIWLYWILGRRNGSILPQDCSSFCLVLIHLAHSFVNMAYLLHTQGKRPLPPLKSLCRGQQVPHPSSTLELSTKSCYQAWKHLPWGQVSTGDG